MKKDIFGKHLADNIYVSSQIVSESLSSIIESGFKTVVCNRPDGEDAEQVNHELFKDELSHFNINFVYLPLIIGGIQPSDVSQFQSVKENNQLPMLLYCRTGSRSTLLWCLSEMITRSIADIVDCAYQAGYNMSHLLNKSVDIKHNPQN